MDKNRITRPIGRKPCDDWRSRKEGLPARQDRSAYLRSMTGSTSRRWSIAWSRSLRRSLIRAALGIARVARARRRRSKRTEAVTTDSSVDSPARRETPTVLNPSNRRIRTRIYGGVGGGVARLPPISIQKDSAVPHDVRNYARSARGNAGSKSGTNIAAFD
jgi:hypothetical protein